MARLRKRASSPAAPVVKEVQQQEEEEVAEQEEQQDDDEQQEEQDVEEQEEEVAEEQSVEGAPHALQFNETLISRPGKPIAISELLRRLKALHRELSELDQEVADRDSLVPVAQQLAQRTLLDHKDRGVQAWTALCVVEMFKLLAPDAPFKPSQLKVNNARNLRFMTWC